MHDYRPNEVSMGLKFLHFFHGVVVKDAKMEIIRAANNPLILNDESDGAYGEGGGLDGADAGLGRRGGTLEV